MKFSVVIEFNDYLEAVKEGKFSTDVHEKYDVETECKDGEHETCSLAFKICDVEYGDVVICGEFTSECGSPEDCIQDVFFNKFDVEVKSIEVEDNEALDEEDDIADEDEDEEEIEIEDEECDDEEC